MENKEKAVLSQVDVVNHVACECSITKTAAKDAVDSAFGFIIDSIVAGQKLRIGGLGAFEVSKREAHTGRNPKTKEVIEIPATAAVTFKVSAPLKESVKAAYDANAAAGKTGKKVR